MSSEPQPRRTAEKRRFSNTAVQAIHQRRRWAVARVGAMVRCGGGRAPALQTPARRPQLQLWLYPTRVAAGAQRPACQPPAAQAIGARRKRRETLALSGTWATPNPQLPGTATLGHSGVLLAKRKGFSLSSLGGKLRHGNWKRANVCSRTWSWS